MSVDDKHREVKLKNIQSRLQNSPQQNCASANEHCSVFDQNGLSEEPLWSKSDRLDKIRFLR